MTDYEQQVAIAEWMGWQKSIERRGRVTQGDVVVWRLNGAEEELPAYTSDLNAIHEAEKRLSQYEQERFGGFLYHGRVCGFQDFCTGVMVFRFAHATAAQRCEALLRAAGLWPDED